MTTQEHGEPGEGRPLPHGDAPIETAALASLLALPSDAIEAAALNQLDRFRIERLLGRGGGGLVYLALDPRLGRRVAIKLVRGAVGGSDRLEREARLLAMMSHPSIATVYSLEEAAAGLTVLVTEYIRGETLAARLSRGPLAMNEALRIGGAVASAIEAAHQKLVLHCDIKPANIMLTDGSGVKVVDFGLARLLVEGGHGEGGTPGYASPEQVAGKIVGPAADVFSLGCVVFECVSGGAPFESNEGLGVTSVREPNWSLLPRETPTRVVEILRRALQREAENRQVSAGELRRVLEQALAGPADGPSGPPNNLPVQFTSFVGRAENVREVGACVRTDRLVTLVGTGGCGKTRLAIAVARAELPRFAPGTWFVELVPCSTEADVVAAIAQVLGVHEQPGKSLEALVTAAVTDRPMLLLLDNCEHLLDSCAAVVRRLLGQCPSLHILATSREALGVVGERVYRVPSLTLPGKNKDSDAVRLFVERAVLVRPEFQLEANRVWVEDICRKLDGIPLAIELAAARLRHTTASQLSASLSDRFRILTAGNRGSLPRHQTLRNLIDWSYSLLTDQERALFARLSIFLGGWTLEGADAAGRASGLGAPAAGLLIHLANKSLIVFEEVDGEPRFRMLDTLRQYAAERLAESEADRVEPLRRSHAVYFLELAERANQRLTGAEQQRSLAQLTIEHDNCRAALRWLEGQPAEGQMFLRLAVALTQFWYMRGLVNEGRSWLSRAWQAAEGSPPDLRAQAANCLGILAWVCGDQGEAIRYYEQSADLWEEVGNMSRLAAVTSNLAAAAADVGEVARARDAHERAVEAYGRLGDPVGVARAKLNYSVMLNQEGEHKRAEELIAASLPVFEREGDDHRIAAAIHNRGHARYGAGLFTDAAECFRKSLAAREALDDRIGIALDVLWLGLCSASQGNAPEAVEKLTSAEHLRKETGATLSRVDQRELDVATKTLQSIMGHDAYEAARKSCLERGGPG